ncbi:hypothetical protein EG327_000169 [Venturia inaequalis]|uniref:Uncharacterized protein n=1 Tax=Venturia inaequalis TaxID=5025 RepID=A0A8H3UA28_VENIN|nr:hypothetical protein EG327_000169 [Venturia inaequalis]
MPSYEGVSLATLNAFIDQFNADLEDTQEDDKDVEEDAPAQTPKKAPPKKVVKKRKATSDPSTTAKKSILAKRIKPNSTQDKDEDISSPKLQNKTPTKPAAKEKAASNPSLEAKGTKRKNGPPTPVQDAAKSLSTNTPASLEGRVLPFDPNTLLNCRVRLDSKTPLFRGLRKAQMVTLSKEHNVPLLDSMKVKEIKAILLLSYSFVTNALILPTNGSSDRPRASDKVRLSKARISDSDKDMIL